MERVPLGTRINSFGIQRFDVAAGTIARIVLLTEEMCVKHLAFDEKLKRSVEVDQEMVLQYGFKNPYTVGLFLVAKLNTDQAGNIMPGTMGSKFTVEYLRLSASQANELNRILDESDFATIKVEKNVKKVEGKDFSTLSFSASSGKKYPLPADLANALEEFKTPERINSLWQMVDQTTSMSKEEYRKAVAENGDAHAQLPAPKKAEALPPKQSAAVEEAEIVAEDPFKVGPADEFESQDFA